MENNDHYCCVHNETYQDCSLNGLFLIHNKKSCIIQQAEKFEQLIEELSSNDKGSSKLNMLRYIEQIKNISGVF